MIRSMIAAVLVGVVSVSALAQSQSPSELFDSAKGAYMLVQYDIAGQAQDGKLAVQTMSGPALCVDPSGVFMTFGLERGMQPAVNTTTAPTQPGEYSNLKIVEPGIGGKSYKAQFVSTDALTGLSFVKVAEAGKFEAVKFVETAPTIGQRIVSVGVMPGDPGFTRYMGLGYVSALVRIPNKAYFVTGGSLTAPLSVVLSESGQALGMVFASEPARPFQTTIQMQNQQAAQIGLIGQLERQYFVPASEFVYVIKNFAQQRQLPWMGVLQFGPVADKAAVAAQGVLAEQPAAKAGLKEGDLVVALNNEPVERLSTPQLTAAAFSATFLRNSAGETITLSVEPKEGGAAKSIQVKLEPQPAMAEEAPKHLSIPLGVLVRDRVLLDNYILPGKAAAASGALVMAIVQGGLLEQLQANDIITAVNGEAIANVGDFRKVSEAAIKAEKPVTLTVIRGDQQLAPIQVKLPPAPTTAPATAPAAAAK